MASVFEGVPCGNKVHQYFFRGQNKDQREEVTVQERIFPTIKAVNTIDKQPQGASKNP